MNYKTYERLCGKCSRLSQISNLHLFRLHKEKEVRAKKVKHSIYKQIGCRFMQVLDYETAVFSAVLSHPGTVESMEQFAGYNHTLGACLSQIIPSALPHFSVELLLTIYREGLLSLVHWDCCTCTSRWHSRTCSAMD